VANCDWVKGSNSYRITGRMNLHANIRRSPWSDEAGLPPALGLSVLLEKFNHDLGMVRPREVEELERSVPTGEREAFRATLMAIAPWRTLKGVAQTVRALAPALSQDSPLCLPMSGTVADVLGYLVHRKRILGGSVPFPAHKNLRQTNGSVLLENWALARIENDPKFARTLLEQRMQLLLVPGLNQGFSSLFGRSPQEIAEFALAKGRNPKGTEHENEVTRVEEMLQRASITHRLSTNLARKMVVCPLPAPNPATDSASLAEALSAQSGITETQLQTWRERLPPALGNALRELFASNIKVLSFDTLMRATHTLFERLDAFRVQRGVAPSNVWLFVPDECNSMQLAALLARCSGAAFSVVGPGSLTRISRAGPANEPKLLAVIDDVALTGDTLAKQYAWLRKQLPASQQSFFVGALACTSVAENIFRAHEAHDSGLRFCGVEHVPVLSEAPLLERGDPETDQVIQILTQFAGYGGLGTMLVLPFGAPNNNHLFFNQTVAPLLTFGGGGVRAVAGLGKLTAEERARVQRSLEDRLGGGNHG
jgi:hypothetical protein